MPVVFASRLAFDPFDSMNATLSPYDGSITSPVRVPVTLKT
jgi:hypothetical protein